MWLFLLGMIALAGAEPIYQCQDQSAYLDVEEYGHLCNSERDCTDGLDEFFCDRTQKPAQYTGCWSVNRTNGRDILQLTSCASCLCRAKIEDCQNQDTMGQSCPYCVTNKNLIGDGRSDCIFGVDESNDAKALKAIISLDLMLGARWQCLDPNNNNNPKRCGYVVEELRQPFLHSVQAHGSPCSIAHSLGPNKVMAFKNPCQDQCLRDTFPCDVSVPMECEIGFSREIQHNGQEFCMPISTPNPERVSSRRSTQPPPTTTSQIATPEPTRTTSPEPTRTTSPATISTEASWDTNGKDGISITSFIGDDGEGSRENNMDYGVILIPEENLDFGSTADPETTTKGPSVKPSRSVWKIEFTLILVAVSALAMLLLALAVVFRIVKRKRDKATIDTSQDTNVCTISNDYYGEDISDGYIAQILDSNDYYTPSSLDNVESFT